jgi:DNA-binding FadR family transcriptional regulator
VVTDDPLLRPVKDGNTFEQTVERLATAIRMGVVETGERLPPERDLADQLNVSRVTLREAIKALNQAGYVQSTRGRNGGTVVVYDPKHRPAGDARREARKLGAPAVLDALAFRAVVEPGAAELAASRDLDAVDRDRLLAALERVGDAEGQTRHQPPPSPPPRLHVLIGELSGSASVAASVAEVQGRLDALLAAIPVFERNMAHSEEQHAAIVRAIVRGRPAEARKAMAEHVAATAHLLRGLLA